MSRLGVFGSFARNEMAHDINLLIEDDLSLEIAWQFKQSLENLVDNRLSIMIKRWVNSISLHFCVTLLKVIGLMRKRVCELVFN